MGTSKYRNPVLHVVMFDGAEWDVQVLNPDMLAWEEYSGRKRLTGQLTMLTYVSWRASLRDGQIPTSVGWEAFSTELCAEVRDPGSVDVPPTRPGPVTG